MGEELRRQIEQGLSGILKMNITPFELGKFIRDNMSELYHSILRYIEIDLWFAILVNLAVILASLIITWRLLKAFRSSSPAYMNYATVVFSIVISVYFGSEMMTATKKLLQFKVAPEVYVGVEVYKYVEKNKTSIVEQSNALIEKANKSKEGK